MTAPPSLKRWEYALNNLVADTQDEKVPWKPVKSEHYVPEDTVGAMFRTKWNDRVLLSFRRNYTYTALNIFKPIVSQFTDPKEETRVRAELAIYDTDAETIIYSFPYSEILDDLYRAVTYYAAGVDEFVDSLLADNPD